MKKYLVLLIMPLIMFLISGCAVTKQKNLNGTQDIGNYPPPNQSTIPTYESNPMDLTYPSQSGTPLTPQITQEIVFLIPTPTNDSAVLIGTLLTPDQNGTPYLADIILGNTVAADQPGYPPMISYSDNTSLRAVQNKDGLFYFENVPPGKYALLIATPLNAQLILDIKTNSPLLVTATAGTITNLGIIPIP